MFYEKTKSPEDIQYVIDRLNKEAIFELKILYGKIYKEKVLQLINQKNNQVFLIRLKNTNEPVGVFGIFPQEGISACGIFFLTTENLHKGNKITLLKGAKRQIKVWQNEYKLIMDSCLKANKTIIKWLTLLGFTPSDDFQDENFQIYYIGDINEYN